MNNDTNSKDQKGMQNDEHKQDQMDKNKDTKKMEEPVTAGKSNNS